MKYINRNCSVQDQPCDLGFTLNEDRPVNSVRYDMAYVDVEGKERSFSIYLPNDVFPSHERPGKVRLRIGIDYS